MTESVTSNTFSPDVLASPSVAPAVEAHNRAVDAASAYIAETQRVLESEDFTDKGRAKLVEKAQGVFDEALQITGRELENTLESANQRLSGHIQEALDFDKPLELSPTSQLEATFQIEEAKSLSPAELVAAYEDAIRAKDYIKRRALEAAAGAVLRRATGNEDVRFNMLKRAVYQPSNPKIDAARQAVEHIEKISTRLNYAMQTVKQSRREPFGKL